MLAARIQPEALGVPLTEALVVGGVWSGAERRKRALGTCPRREGGDYAVLHR
ncbi:MAG: hypothetical protein WKF82_06965 [Nocardioidaceae bacterium]